jgi:3-oxoacyl-[acyl-carrier protein] reductase
MKRAIPDPEVGMRDEVAIITGAANGIGRHFAGEMIERGHRLALTDIDTETLEARFEANDRVMLVGQDIRDKEGWRSLFDRVIECWGRVDYLFNNAGVILPGFAHEAELGSVDHITDVNVKGTMYGTLLACRVMKDQGFGHIVNVASLTGVAPVAGNSIYSGSKFAIRGFSLAVAHELVGTGVSVTVVCPDLVDTAMLDLQLDYESAALSFSGPRALTVEEVSRALFRVMEKRPMEVTLPLSRGLLCRAGNLAPGAATILTTSLTRKGLKTMQRLKSERQGPSDP